MSTCVYKLICTANKRFYIGSAIDFAVRKRRHLRDLRAGTHINVFLQRTFDKYGEAAFKWKVIRVNTLEEARALEQHYIDKYKDAKRCMNIGRQASGGDNLTNNPRRKEIIASISRGVSKTVAALTEEERKEKWGQPGALNGMYGRTHTDEAREIIRKANLGRTPTNKGVPLSDEQRRKVSEARKGKCVGADNPFYGKHHSVKTKRLMARKAKARCSAPDFIHHQARRVKCDGKVYVSVSEAARQIGCSAGTILFRIKSPNFKYKYL